MEPDTGESLFDMIADLGDFTDPPPVSMFPATWGWVAVGLILLALLAVAFWFWLRHYRANAYRRAALAEVDALQPALAAGDPTALGALQTILRRTALVAFPRSDIAALTGKGWADFLTRTGGQFDGAALADAPYRPVAFYDGAATIAAARHWIRHHHA